MQTLRRMSTRPNTSEAMPATCGGTGVEGSGACGDPSGPEVRGTQMQTLRRMMVWTSVWALAGVMMVEGGCAGGGGGGSGGGGGEAPPRAVRCQGAGAGAGIGISARPMVVSAINRLAASSGETPWRGTLTYLDYTSKTRETIRSNVRVRTEAGGTRQVGNLPHAGAGAGSQGGQVGNLPHADQTPVAGAWRWDVSYTDEPKADAGAALTISADGQTLRNGDSVQRIVSEESPQPGELVLTTEERGQDDGRAAVIRRVYRFEPRVLTLTKFVRFESDSAGAGGAGAAAEEAGEILRHEYRWVAGQ